MEPTLRVFLPYGKEFITQRFGANANGSYARDGLKGHTAYDWGAPYGAEIENCTPNAYCYSLMHKDDPDPTKFRAVFMLVETLAGVYEVSYGHCSDIFAEIGKTYQVGDRIAMVGNTGDVFVGQHEVTKEERLSGSHAGAHLHGPQIRPVKKVPQLKPNKHYLQNATGNLFLNEMYYEIIDFDNGYNGCVSLAPFSTETLASKGDIKTATDLVNQAQVLGDQIQHLPDAQKRAIQPLFLRVLKSISDFLKTL